MAILLQFYFDARLAEAIQQNKADIVTQQQQIKQLAARQKRLTEQAKIIQTNHEKLEARKRQEIERLRRINNDRFCRWLDNARWSLNLFCTETSTIAWTVLITFALSSVPYWYIGRAVFGPECSKPLCQSTSQK